MKISYDGPPDFGNETITIKIELQPSEVADVIRKLIGAGAVELARDLLPPEPDRPFTVPKGDSRAAGRDPRAWRSPGGAGQWNG